MVRDDLSIHLTIALRPRVSVNIIVNFRFDWRVTVVNWVFNDAYNYEIIDIRFFSCMNQLVIRCLYCIVLHSLQCYILSVTLIRCSFNVRN